MREEMKFDRVYAVIYKGVFIAGFPDYPDAYKLAKKLDKDDAESLVQNGPYFMGWDFVKKTVEYEEEEERQAFAEMLRTFQGADYE